MNPPFDKPLVHRVTPKEPRVIPADAVAIWSGEWDAWWRDNAAGYTAFSGMAGVYTREVAESLTRHCGPEKKIEIRPHPFAGATIAGRAVPIDGSMEHAVTQVLYSDDGKYKIAIKFVIGGHGMIIENVSVKEA